MKEEAILRLVGGENTQNGLVPHLHEVIKGLKLGSVSGLQRSSIRSNGSQSYTRPPHLSFQGQEEESP